MIHCGWNKNGVRRSEQAFWELLKAFPHREFSRFSLQLNSEIQSRELESVP